MVARVLDAQCFEQIRLKLDLAARIAQNWSVNQENVFDALAKRHDFSGVQIDMVLRQDIRNGIQETIAVIRRD